jgi:hypothetical protein
MLLQKLSEHPLHAFRSLYYTAVFLAFGWDGLKFKHQPKSQFPTLGRSQTKALAKSISKLFLKKCLHKVASRLTN